MGWGDRATQDDIRRVETAAADRDRKARMTQQEDVVIDNNRRLLLRSPNGHFWAIVVSDAGGLSTVDMGINAL